MPVSVLVAVFSAPLGDLITGTLPAGSAHIAGRALAVLVPAAFGQLLAALAASALAAIDSYGTAAAGFALGGIVGLIVFAALAGPSRDRRARVGARGECCDRARRSGRRSRAQAVRSAGRAQREPAVLPRLWHLLQGAAVPLALQGCYLLALRFAAKLGVGSVTSFSYAYLAASTLVAATAFSLGLISSAPLTRRGVDPREAGRHVVHAGWVSLSLVGAAAGVFALVGGRIVQFVLGDAYRRPGRPRARPPRRVSLAVDGRRGSASR